MPARKKGTAEFDVMVAGAGPGGATAAYWLARHGVNVLLAEKASFPREKVCGDGLTPRAVRALLDMGIRPEEDPGFVRVEGLRVYGPRGALDLPWPALSDWPGYGLVRTRHDYDELLAGHARAAGATLWERAEVTAPVMDRGWVAGAMVRRARGARGGSSPATTMEGRAGRRANPPIGQAAREAEVVDVRARFVIAADGASSRFAGQAGVRRDATRPLGIAARRYYHMARPQVRMLEAWLTLEDQEAVLPGYGWIFPLQGDVVNVGAGLLNTFKGFKDISARRIFDVFVKQLPADWGITGDTAVGPLASGPLPMGFNRRPLAMPGVLVVGDAGGVVNPFNGEGICYAMETGKLAAELVFEALAKGKPGLAHVYPTLVRERYGKYYFMGNVWVRWLGHPKFMSFATRHGLHRETLMRFAMRVLANLTDGPRGDVQDKLFAALEALAPAA